MNKKVKVLVYFDSMNNKGGVERVIANLFNKLVETFDITILTTDDTRSAYYLNKNINRISMGNPRILNMNKSKLYRACQVAISIIKNHFYLKKIIGEYDVIYVASHLTALELFLLGNEARQKTIVSVHDAFDASNGIYQLIKRKVYPKMRYISCPTTTDTKKYADLGCKSVYIPHLSTFKPEKKNRINKIAINVGRLTSDKQQLLLLKIWNELKVKSKLNGWILKIIGDGELRTKLEAYIAKNKMEDCVRLIGHTDSIEDYYEEAGLFLFTSKMEGFGMVLLEAMSYSVPCISFDCESGPRDIIINGINGYLVNCYDVNDYKRIVQNLVSDPRKIKALSKSAYDYSCSWNNAELLKKWSFLFENTAKLVIQ